LTAQRNEKKLTPICNIIKGFMDLRHINLPASVIANLYHSSLIEISETPTKFQLDSIYESKSIPDQSTAAGWKYLGENQKNILIIVNHPDVVYLPDDELNFLTGILGACKLSIGDVAIVNLNNHPGISYKELTNDFKSKSVFLFGVEPAIFGLPISFPHFQLQSFANNSFLFSPELKELENDNLLKSKLWVCLKRIFGI
jgi:hypothetical protein